MPAIGESLREARMRQRIDLAEVSARTKIRAKYLRALENEDFDQLPGPTYVRTFLRTYATFLGLDAHLLVEEYRTRHEPVVEEEQHFAPAPTAPARRREPSYRPLGPGPGPGGLIAGAALILVGIFLVIGLLTDEGGEQPTTAARQTTDAGGRPRGEDTRRSRERTEEQPPPDTQTVVVRPDGATYLCADDGEGEILFEDTITGPERLRSEVVRLNLGRSAGLEVNGRQVALEESPNPIGIEFSRRGRRSIPDGERPCQ